MLDNTARPNPAPNGMKKMPEPLPPLQIGWTTVETREQAQKLADILVASRFVACVQIDGPILSTYLWKNEIKHAEEFRLTIKYPMPNSEIVADIVHKNHPYEVPQWLAVPVVSIGKKYLEWAYSMTVPAPRKQG